MTALPKRRAKTYPEKYYLVSRCPKNREHKLGLYFERWPKIQELIEHPSLAGSGFHLKVVESVEEAEAYWQEHGWELPVPRFDLAD